MELQELLDEMETIILTSTNAAQGFRDLCGHCNQIKPHEVWGELAAMDVSADLKSLEKWLKDTLTAQQPPSEIKAFYFGILDSYTDQGDATTLLYIAGNNTFDPDDEAFDWATDPDWFPDDRYTESTVLAALARRAEELALEDGPEEEDEDADWAEEDDELIEDDEDELEDEEDEEGEAGALDFDTLLSYFLTLSYGALATGHLCRTLGSEVLLAGGAKLRVVGVGFDEGDAIILGEMRQDGWHQLDIER